MSTPDAKTLPEHDVEVNFRPAGARLLVQPLEKDEVTASGIILASVKDESPPQRGRVLRIGEGEPSEQTGTWLSVPFLPGDVVWFGRYAGTEIRIKVDRKETDCRVLHVKEVLGSEEQA